MRVLIPSGPSACSPGYISGYRSLGHEAVVELRPFLAREGGYDVVHLLWPEALSRWTEPDAEGLRRIEADILWWKNRSKLVASVQNLHPHGYPHSESYDALYRLVYGSCDAIHHFSRASLELTSRRHPILANKRNRVTPGFSYPWLVNPAGERSALRRALGLGEDERVVLILGSMRRAQELQLIMDAFSGLEDIRLLVLERYRRPALEESQISRWRSWLLSRGSLLVEGEVPDGELYRYIEPADAIFVPRIEQISSGIVCLGLTFGQVVVAPSLGAIPEYLEGTPNFLYRAADAPDAARALERAMRCDRRAVRAANKRLAESRGWERVAGACLDALEDLAGR